MEVINDVKPQMLGVAVGELDLWEPINTNHLQGSVESSTDATAGLFNHLDLTKRYSSTIDEEADEFAKYYEATMIEVPVGIRVDPVVVGLDKCRVTDSPVESKTTLPYPSFSKAHSKDVPGMKDIDVDDSLGQISVDTIHLDQVQGISTGSPAAMQESEQSKFSQSPPDPSSPAQPKVKVEHENRADKARIVTDDVDVVPDTPKYVAFSNRSSANGTEPFVNLREILQTIQSEECTVENVESRTFPFLNAESWRTPESFVGDVVKDSVLMRSLDFDDFYSLVSNKNPGAITTLVKALIKFGLQVELSLYTDTKEYTPLLNILDWGDGYQELFKLLIDAGALIDNKTIDGWTPLRRAAANGFLWAVEMLVDAGVDPKRPVQCTALGTAAYRGHLEAVRYLIENVKISSTPQILRAVIPLHHACLGAQVPVVKCLLEQYRSFIDFEARYATHHIDPDVSKDTSKWSWMFSKPLTPLLHAYYNNKAFADRLEVIKLLLKHGADPTGGPEVMTGNYSLIHIAAADGQIELVKVLLQYHVKISTRTVPVFSGRTQGFTPITLAEEYGHKEVAEILRAEKKARKGK